MGLNVSQYFWPSPPRSMKIQYIKNPAMFLTCLRSYLIKFTNVNQDFHKRTIAINTYFISQSAPDIWAKLQKAELGPQNPQSFLI